MSWLLELIRECGYPVSKRGACWGLASMAEQARNRNDFNYYKLRQFYLATLANRPGALSQAIAVTRLKVSVNLPLNLIEQMLIEIPAFFEGVYVYQNPEVLKSWPEFKNTSLPQTTEGHELVRALYLSENDQPKTKSIFYLCGHFAPDLILFLQGLRFIANIHSVGLRIDAKRHAIYLHFTAETQCWEIINNSKLSIYTDEISVVAEIISHYRFRPTEALSLICSNLTITEQDVFSYICNTNLINPGNAIAYPELLVLVSKNNSLPIINYLIHKGVNVNYISAIGYTAAFIAIINNNENVLKTLINAKADLRIADTYGKTPLQWAISQGKLSLAKTILKHTTATYGLQFNGVNHQTFEGITALHIAVVSDNYSMCELLLNYGADIYKTDNLGISPLKHAVLNNKNEIKDLLLKQKSILTHLKRQRQYSISMISVFNPFNVQNQITCTSINSPSSRP